jgi:hypothetical protein
MQDRVIVLIDANEGEVLDAPDNVSVEFIPWEKIVDVSYDDPQFVNELDEALLAKDYDKALAMTKAWRGEEVQ